jgi:hypothetical protein
MFLNQCSTVVFMKVSRSERISLTCLQPEQSLITLLYRRVAPFLVYFYNSIVARVSFVSTGSITN